MRRLPLLFLLTALLLAACGGDPAGPTPDLPAASTATATATGGASEERRPGWITGKATDAQGRPLSGARVIMRSGFVSLGNNILVEAETDGTGRYAAKVPETTYKITAYLRAGYKGRQYQLWLHPADDSTGWSEHAGGGVVKDFVWRLSGPKPEAEQEADAAYLYYGGVIDLRDAAEYGLSAGGYGETPQYPPGARMRLELTPDGPLFDGSAGEVVVREVAAERQGRELLADVPLGDYTARASLVEPGGRVTPLLVATRLAGESTGEAGEVGPVRFLPSRLGDYGLSDVAMYILPRQ